MEECCGGYNGDLQKCAKMTEKRKFKLEECDVKEDLNL